MAKEGIEDFENLKAVFNRHFNTRVHRELT
jgi:hypothetical protein